jgi:hypothetical protein
MGTVEFSADYQRLQQIAIGLDQWAQESYATGTSIARQVDELQAGGWQGIAANEFYIELDELIYPLLKMTIEDLSNTSAAIMNFIQLMMETDAATSTYFTTSGGGGGNGGQGGTQPISDPNTAGGGFSWSNFGQELLFGNFHKGETTWAGTLGNVGIGLIPIVGQIADARDTAAAVGEVWDNPSSWAAWGGLGLAVVGWVPLLGDGIKGGVKIGRKVLGSADEVASVVKHAPVEHMPTKLGPQVWTSDLRHVTGRTAQNRNRAIDAIIKEDFPNLRLSHKPEYDPFIRTGMAKMGEGTRLGKNSFGSRYDLRDVIIHEELHHRWWAKGRFNHHATEYVPDEHFYNVIERYKRMRDYRSGGQGNPWSR